ncbi:hypothetical protein FHT22_001152 [Pedobacter sp. SG918]|nr:hypothetical protein [Pedobacter sp. SG918]
MTKAVLRFSSQFFYCDIFPKPYYIFIDTSFNFADINVYWI